MVGKWSPLLCYLMLTRYTFWEAEVPYGIIVACIFLTRDFMRVGLHMGWLFDPRGGGVPSMGALGLVVIEPWCLRGELDAGPSI